MKKRGIEYLSKEELDIFRAAIQNRRDLLLLNILYETGCTVNELVNIKIQDIDFEKNTISFPPESTKSGKSRTSFISGTLARRIKNHKDSGYLFTSRQSSKITTKRVRQIIQSYSKSAGLGKINPQVLRYTHIAHALERSIPITAIQKQVGMEGLRIVQIYESLVPEEKENVYEKFWSNE